MPSSGKMRQHRQSSSEKLTDSRNGARVDTSPGSNDRSNTDRNFEGTQAQILLMALQNFILPIIGKSSMLDRQDILQVSSGPEAEEFLTALQKYISCIIMSSQLGQVHIVEESERTEDPACLPETVPKEDDSSDADSDSPANTPSLERNIINGSSMDLDQSQHLISLDKMLSGLRQHVFNKMPIRLLCFEMRAGSKSNVTLLERGAVYAYLARKLHNEFSGAMFYSKVTLYMDYGADRPWAEQQVIQNWVSKIAKYAILSHTWLRGVVGEVTYGDWCGGAFDTGHPGYRKLVNFCKVAADDHGLALSWMDTVCINKDSSAELDESIRSMYKWYRDAEICITYLAETAQLSDMHNDPWFSRGWTLQELLAPAATKFYGKNWMQLVKDGFNDKQNPEVQKQIELATTITSQEMSPYYIAPISRRMEWAAQREVTREEDTAYSLMGIFNVNIPIAYGEGINQAFPRLLKEILNSTYSVLDIFNWAGPYAYETPVTSLLPSNPKAYLRRSLDIQLSLRRPIEPLTLTHLGLRIPILMMPAIPTKNPRLLYSSVGAYYATVTINTPDNGGYPRSYNLLDERVSTQHAVIRMSAEVSLKAAFGVLNIKGDETSIYIPKTCFAVVLVRDVEGGDRGLGTGRKVVTDVPTVFRLNKRKSASASKNYNEPGDEDVYYEVERDKLAWHGMHLVTMYL